MTFLGLLVVNVFRVFFGRFGEGDSAIVVPFGAKRRVGSEGDSKLFLYRDRDVLVDGARVSLLFLYTKFGQQFEDPVRLYL